MKSAFTIILLTFLTSCATKSMITLNSTPSEAKVSVRAVGSSHVIDLGSSPVRITGKDLRDKIESEKPIEITVVKDGYNAETFIATDYYNNNLTLEINLEVAPIIKDGKKVDEVVAGLFECHRLMKAKKIKEAQQRISKLIETYPQVSSLYEFQGSIYYVLNEKEKAYDSFNMAVKYNEDNQEARRMMAILKQSSEKKN